jgi:ribosome biogenesis protein ERB1
LYSYFTCSFLTSAVFI